MFEDDDLIWLPSSSRRSAQLPPNLRSSYSVRNTPAGPSAATARSARISSIFSADPVEDDDPFGLKKLNNNLKTASVVHQHEVSAKTALLVDIGSSDGFGPTVEEDVASLLEQQVNNASNDSLLPLKLSGCDLINDDSLEPSSGSNGLTDWDRLQREASAVVGDIGSSENPKKIEMKFLSDVKILDLSNCSSPGLINARLEDIDEFPLISDSPNLMPRKFINFEQDSSEAKNTTEKSRFKSPCKTPMTKKFLTKPRQITEEAKENIPVRTKECLPRKNDEVFIDHQLEDAINSLNQKLSSFSTPSRCSGSSRTVSTASNVSSIKEKSLISSTPVVASSAKSRTSFYGRQCPTPVRSDVANRTKDNFKTPQKISAVKPSPIRPVMKPNSTRKSFITPMSKVSTPSRSTSSTRQSSATPVTSFSSSKPSVPRSRYSMVSPSPLRPDMIKSSSRRSINPTPTGSFQRPASTAKPSSKVARSLQGAFTGPTNGAGATPALSKPSIIERQSSSKLQSMRYGTSLLPSKQPMSAPKMPSALPKLTHSSFPKASIAKPRNLSRN